MLERIRLLPLALAIIVVAIALVSPAAASAQSGAPATCPATFQVLHDDKIGSLSLPAGAYTRHPAQLGHAELRARL